MTTTGPIRILLVDDHAVVRQGFAALLELQPDFRIAGHASSGREAITQYPQLQPDIVLMDLNLPDTDGAVAIQAIVEQDPCARIIVLTMYDNEERLLRALRCGAKTYVLKTAEPETLIDTIRNLANNEFSTGGLATGQAAVQRAAALERLTSPQRELLSPRELSVLTHIARGKSNDEIASTLFMSINTVKSHVRSVLLKLDAKSRTAAVARAVRLDIIDPGATREG